MIDFFQTAFGSIKKLKIKISCLKQRTETALKYKNEFKTGKNAEKLVKIDQK